MHYMPWWWTIEIPGQLLLHAGCELVDELRPKQPRQCKMRFEAVVFTAKQARARAPLQLVEPNLIWSGIHCIDRS
jgi:hypothetical protein